MSRTTNFMILSFSLLQTWDRVMSSKGNRTLCIVNGPEKYDTLKTSLGSVVSDINCIIKKWKRSQNRDVFRGDYKFLLITMALKGATLDYARVWCRIHNIQRWDMTKDLDFYNSGEFKRTLKEIRDFHGSKKFCYIHPPV